MTDNEPKTETVPLDAWTDFREGDQVVSIAPGHGTITVERVLPPKPKLPTTNGSIVTQAYQDKDAELGRIAAFLLDGTWYDTARPGRRVGVPSKWATGWTLVYEAPADNLPTLHQIDNALRGGSDSYHIVVDSMDAARRVFELLLDGNK